MSQAIGAALAFAVPVLVWVGAVVLIVGSFFSSETAEYRQFVWISDALRDGLGVFGSRFRSFSHAFVDTLGTRDVLPLLAVLLGAVAIRRAWGGRDASPEESGNLRDLNVVAVLTIAAFMLFLWLLGYYRARLTFALAPPVILLAAGQLEWLRRRWPNIVAPAALAASGAWVVIHMIRSGPYV